MKRVKCSVFFANGHGAWANIVTTGIPQHLLKSNGCFSNQLASIMFVIIFEPQEFTATVTWAQSLEVTTGGLLGGIDWLKRLQKKLFSHCQW